MSGSRISARAVRQRLKTPYYFVDERGLLKNLKVIERIRRDSGAKVVLALKCFSTWCVFDLMKKYMDGTTSSSLFEARLGHEKFGKEVHAYSVAWNGEEVDAVAKFADKIIFNSLSQLKQFEGRVGGMNVGLRVNPGFSFSDFDLADPARKYSRLGVSGRSALRALPKCVKGLMFHYNCENNDFANFRNSLETLGELYGPLLRKLEWISLGGGVFFTQKGYPIDDFCSTLKEFSRRFGVQIYLEPGEAAITHSAELVTTVLDIVRNKMDIAIVDASTEANMLDLLIYRQSAKIDAAGSGRYRYIVAGRSCLAGDIFGTFRFEKKLKIGDTINMADAAGYTMVKKNWFNGLPMPAIVVRRLSGKVDVVRRFEYRDFMGSLS